MLKIVDCTHAVTIICLLYYYYYYYLLFSYKQISYQTI